jgi:SAM-dependent methyltransferase
MFRSKTNALHESKVAGLRADLAKVKAARDGHKAKLVEIDRARSYLGVAQNAGFELFEQFVASRFSQALPTQEASVHISYREGLLISAPKRRWLYSGYLCAHQIKETLAKHLPDFRPTSVLDFGSGPARTTRYLSLIPGIQKIYGCDIDDTAIQWLNALPECIGHFFTVGDRPPFPTDLPKFDLILAQSVFTHLPEDLEEAWLSALRQQLAPGGVMLLTYHGPSFNRWLPEDQRSKLESTGFAYSNRGITPGLPDYYQTSWHSHDGIRQRWSKYGQVLATLDFGLEGQDLAILQG